MEKQQLILVPKEWFESLLEGANNLELEIKNWEYGNPNNDRIHSKSVQLMGYAKSASTILKYNERVEK